MLILNRVKKETLAQVFSCEFCEISKSTFFHRTPLVAASVFMNGLITDLHSKVPMDKIKKATKHVAATLPSRHTTSFHCL